VCNCKNKWKGNPYITFADDIAMVTEIENDMQQSLATLNEILKRYLIKINVRKTKVMVVSKESSPHC
jgi:hypothetical protein